MNCHDADASLAFDSDSQSSDGYQPFSDGRDPPDIATGWTSASHNTSSLAALADEVCMACHGGPDSTRTGLGTDPNAHGSDHGTLLSERVAGVIVANVEEDLCYACHDGGLALTNIEAEFAKTYGHPLGLAAGVHDPNEPAVVDVRHVECVDCHDTHQAAPRIDLPGPSTLPPARSMERVEWTSREPKPIRPSSSTRSACAAAAIARLCLPRPPIGSSPR